MDTQFRVLLCTAGSGEEAGRIAESLVGSRLAACVNIIPSIRSIYWWNNTVTQDNEVLMLIKTEVSRIPEVEQAIRKLHSYQVPELISLPIEYGLPEYLKWLEDAISRTK
jgi:periplasmic divalent cation tolerance protein